MQTTSVRLSNSISATNVQATNKIGEAPLPSVEMMYRALPTQRQDGVQQDALPLIYGIETSEDELYRLFN